MPLKQFFLFWIFASLATIYSCQPKTFHSNTKLNQEEITWKIKNQNGDSIELLYASSTQTRFGYFYTSDTIIDNRSLILKELLSRSNYKIDSTNALLNFHLSCLINKIKQENEITMVKPEKIKVKHTYITKTASLFNVNPKNYGEYLYFYNHRLYDGDLNNWTDFGINCYYPNPFRDSAIGQAGNKHLYTTSEIIYYKENGEYYPLFLADGVTLNKSFEKLRHFKFLQLRILNDSIVECIAQPNLYILINTNNHRYAFTSWQQIGINYPKPMEKPTWPADTSRLKIELLLREKARIFGE